MNAIRPVVLGHLALCPQTGYEIKQSVDRSTRYFWPASYGQIYPELRRLEEEGLIRGREEAQGGRRRVRYELTRDGERALRDWLASPAAWEEIRDLGLLKLFFAGAAGPESALAAVRSMREERERKLELLLAIEAAGDDGKELTLGPGLVLDYGLSLYRATIDWCRAAEERLAQEVGS